jgi:transcriptional regulator with XRE-family HTH domain
MSATQPRLLTPSELAVFVKFYRQLRHWSQQQLADISKLNVRTVQRVERSEPSDFDTRRAIARAFEFDDIDALNKPIIIPTDEEWKAAKEKFDRDNIMLDAEPLTTGKQLAGLVETTSMDLSAPAFEMTREADEKFASLIDYFRNYRDCAELHSEVQKCEVYDELQRHIDALKALGVSLRYAIRNLLFNVAPGVEPLPTAGLYVVAFPLSKEPKEFATPRAVGVGQPHH